MAINATPKKHRHFSFDAQTAAEYGVDEAIMINNFIFWIEKNIANRKHCHDGRTWTYNTQEAFTFVFNFWSYKQVRRITDSLVKKGVLITGNYNKTSFDRTCWYAFKDERLWLNTLEDNPQILEDVVVPKPANDHHEAGESILSTSRMDSPNQANGINQSGEPIPYIQTNALPDLKHNNSEHEPATHSEKSVNEILSLSLIGLNEKQTAEASSKLAKLSPEQRNRAIDSFNKTVASGKVKSTPMALLNQLVNIGLRNGLESAKAVEAIPEVAQTSKKPVMTLKERESSRLECIKVFVTGKKAELLKEFSERGFIMNRTFGTIIEPDLRLAGLFD